MMRAASGTVRMKERGAPSCVALFLLMKPGIVAAVALAGYAGMVVALGGLPPAAVASSCLTSIILAAAGSAMLNNVLDRRIDLLMERVQKRSAALSLLGPGRVTACALSLIAAALLLAALQLGRSALLLLLCAVLSYTLHYTLCLKRRSPWAALPGALPGALPVLVGASAAGAPLAVGAVLLFLLMLLWQPPHFWLLSLAHQEEYRQAGLPVLPVAKGERFTAVATLTGAAAMVGASLLLWLLGPCSWRYGLWALFLGIAFWGGCCILLAKRLYRQAFTWSVVYLVALLAAVVVDLCGPGG